MLSTREWGRCQRCSYSLLYADQSILTDPGWQKMITRLLHSPPLEWSLHEMEDHWSKASQIPLCSPLKSLMRLERHRNHFHLALSLQWGRVFFWSHKAKSVPLCHFYRIRHSKLGFINHLYGTTSRPNGLGEFPVGPRSLGVQMKFPSAQGPRLLPGKLGGMVVGGWVSLDRG